MSSKPRVVELFAGAGGLSLGLEQAGFEIILANEILRDSAATHELNHPGVPVICGDVHEVDFRSELESLGSGPVDLLSGGPPCQGFSSVGSKNSRDPRNSLFYEFLRAVREVKPTYVLFENVAGFARLYGGQAHQTLQRELAELGYETSSALCDASDYGLPQIRKRTIVIGALEGRAPFAFPKVTHAKARKLTLLEAISDLPELEVGESADRYASAPQNAYQKRMRKGAGQVLTDHDCTSYGERMQEILRLVPPGGCVVDLPERLQPASAFKNSYARLVGDQPSTTVTRNFGTPSSARCIHPHQNRALSTREGARLQSFPDSYRFAGGKTSKNLQIGNSVPPLLGRVIAEQIRAALEAC